MKKKAIALGLLASSIVATSTVALTGCGNMNIVDLNFTMNYIVVEENNINVLHKITKWTDSESESVSFSCPDCGNYVWTSSNTAVVYKNKPPKYAYQYECNDPELER